jgi:hypothetical protein
MKSRPRREVDQGVIVCDKIFCKLGWVAFGKIFMFMGATLGRNFDTNTGRAA